MPLSKKSKSESIVNTPITWEILEHDMQKAFESHAEIGEKRTAELIADGNGYVSYIVLVTFDWTTDKEHLPEKVVVKITSCEKMESLFRGIPGFEADNIKSQCVAANDSELSFYENVFKTIKFPEELRVPKFFCGRPFGIDGVEAGYLAIEHFEGVEMCQMYDTLQESAVLEVIKQLIHLHAHSYKHPELMGKLVDKGYQVIVGEFTSLKKVEGSIQVAIAANPELREKLEKLEPQLKHFAAWDTYQQKMNEKCKNLMLCHGDLWPGNILWRKDEKGDYKMMAIIDLQLSHLGNPLNDLCRLLSTAISGEDYLKKRDFYLETYYELFKEAIEGDPMPWESFDEFLKEYEQLFVLLTVIFGPMCVTTAEMSLGKCREDQKRAAVEVYWGKVGNMLNESIKYMDK